LWVDLSYGNGGRGLYVAENGRKFWREAVEMAGRNWRERCGGHFRPPRGRRRARGYNRNILFSSGAPACLPVHWVSLGAAG
jgi:hypothetical protein